MYCPTRNKCTCISMKCLTTCKPCVLSHKEQMYMYIYKVVDYLLALCIAPQRTLPTVDYVYACALTHKEDLYIYKYGTEALDWTELGSDMQVEDTKCHYRMIWGKYNHLTGSLNIVLFVLLYVKPSKYCVIN